MRDSAHGSNAELAELLFSGDPVAPSAEVFEEARRSNPLWVRVFEQAYKQFAERPENVGRIAHPEGKGASLAQIARLFESVGVRPVVVVARALPAAQTQGLDRLEQRNVDQLLEALKRLHAADGTLNVTTLHHDGKTGHCIRLTNYDHATDRFEYHDPWPGRSLLCEENNRKGVRAEPAGKRWTVQAAELERVLIACFVFPAYWWRAERISPFSVLEKSFEAGGFFAHFHLKSIAEHLDGPLRRRRFAPGPFGQWIQLETVSRPDGRISAASVTADAQWIAGNLNLALDLTKSFVLEFAPNGPDQSVFEELAAALWSLVTDPAAALRLRAADPEQSDVVACVHAFAGSLEHASASTELGSVSIATEHEAAPRRKIDINLY